MMSNSFDADALKARTIAAVEDMEKSAAVLREFTRGPEGGCVTTENGQFPNLHSIAVRLEREDDEVEEFSDILEEVIATANFPDNSTP